MSIYLIFCGELGNIFYNNLKRTAKKTLVGMPYTALDDYTQY
ncbi:hypothetical protein GAPWKB11_1524 [Gilliamella apicola]|nr:hypothetical protein GAPWKB11_1524 [Gilliamella apicola]